MKVLIRGLIQRLILAKSYAGEPPEPAVTTERLNVLRTRATLQLGFSLPEEYLVALEQADGFDFNGLYFLASETRALAGSTERGTIPGVIEDNIEYWQLFESGKIVLAYDDAFAYVYAESDKRYLRITRVAKQAVRDYTGFEEMLADGLDWARVQVSDILPTSYKLSWPATRIEP